MLFFTHINLMVINMNVLIIPYQFSLEELSFLEDFNKVFKKYPFKVFDLIKMLQNKEVTFQRDTTLIITISKLSKLFINDLLEFLNIFCQNQTITKLIYQKEFLIIHFKSEYMIKVLTNKTYYMYIDYYFYLLSLTSEVYLNPVVIINDIKEEVDLVFYYNNEYFIFKKDQTILPYQTYYINAFIDFHEFKKRLFLKYYLSDNMKKYEIDKILEGYNSFK